MPRPAFTRYTPRPLAYLGPREVEGFRLKTYAISVDNRPVAAGEFDGGLALAADELPRPACSVDRHGVGFVILHRGRTGSYVILGWWDRENELPLRVFLEDAGAWRPARGGEGVCVWDLRVIAWEREAYVGNVLSGRPGGVDSYLDAVIEGFA